MSITRSVCKFLSVNGIKPWFIKVRKVKIPKIKNIYKGNPGEVVYKSKKYVFIKTKDSVVKLSLEDSLSTKNQLLLQSLNFGDFLK